MECKNFSSGRALLGQRGLWKCPACGQFFIREGSAAREWCDCGQSKLVCWRLVPDEEWQAWVNWEYDSGRAERGQRGLWLLRSCIDELFIGDVRDVNNGGDVKVIRKYETEELDAWLGWVCRAERGDWIEPRFAPERSHGRKDDGEKPDWSLVPWMAMEQVVEVLGFGARKYGRDNWRKVENAEDRYFAALMRHVVAWRSGRGADGESGRSHLAHAICCALFLMELGREVSERSEGDDV